MIEIEEWGSTARLVEVIEFTIKNAFCIHIVVLWLIVLWVRSATGEQSQVSVQNTLCLLCL